MGRRTLVLIVALLLAGVAAFAVYRFLTGVQDERIAETEFVAVYRAADRIEGGVPGDLVIQQERAVLNEEVSELRPPTAIVASQDPAQDGLQEALSGKVAAGPIPAESVLTTDMWIDPVAAAQPLAEVISGGNQAISLLVDGSRGVAGFIKPNDRVNVLVTLKVEGTPRADTTVIDPEQESGGGSQIEKVTKTLTRYILFGVRVLGVDEELTTGGDGPATVSAPTPTTAPSAVPQGASERLTERTQLVTLEVNSEEAEQLVFALEAGTIWLTLSTDEFPVRDTEGVVIDSLFGDDPGVLGQYFDLP
jgi:pilus assembly protein CpaB